jgi:hypothetical protein
MHSAGLLVRYAAPSGSARPFFTVWKPALFRSFRQPNIMFMSYSNNSAARSHNIDIAHGKPYVRCRTMTHHAQHRHLQVLNSSTCLVTQTKLYTQKQPVNKALGHSVCCLFLCACSAWQALASSLQHMHPNLSTLYCAFETHKQCSCFTATHWRRLHSLQAQPTPQIQAMIARDSWQNI